MKFAPLWLATALAVLGVGCGTSPVRTVDVTAADAPDPGVLESDVEGGMIVAAKAVDIPGHTAPARRADPAAEINGAFGGLIGGMASRRKADEGRNGEALKVLMDQTGRTLEVVQPRGELPLVAGDRVVVRRDAAGNASVERAASRR